MNKLVTGDYYISTSGSDRNVILERLRFMGVPVESDTWHEREVVGDADTYPIIVWTQGEIVVVRSNDERATHELTREEFVTKSGMEITKWAGNKLKCHFV